MSRKPAILAALLLLPAAGGAQTPAGGEVFSGSLDVTAAEVEVFVADRDGRPVSGLSRKDFQVLEDGRPVEVTEVTPASARPLALAVFFDATSLDGTSRSAALRALRSFLAGLGPGDRVVLAGFDGSLAVRSESAGDPALATAVEGLGALSPRGTSAAQERSVIQREILQTPSLSDEQSPAAARSQASMLLARLREYSQTRAGETRAALQGLQKTLEVLAGLPGRRTLLYLGGGLPMRPGAVLYSLWESRFGELAVELAASALDTSRGDASPLVREVADRASAAGAAFFALTVTESGAAGGSEGRHRTAHDAEDSLRALHTLAGATGGRVVADAANPAAALEGVGRDLSGAWSVVYAPSPGGAGDRHRIQVTVRGGSLAARVRPERLRTAPVEPLARQALAALGSAGEDNPLQAALTFEDETPEEGGRFRVTAMVALPLTSIFVQPQEHFHAAHLTLAVAARDAQGRITGIPRAEVPIEIPNERLLSAPGQTAGYRFILHLAPGESIIAVALRDDTSGVESVARSVYIAGPVPSR